jgi:hypothetical protein
MSAEHALSWSGADSSPPPGGGVDGVVVVELVVVAVVNLPCVGWLAAPCRAPQALSTDNVSAAITQSR